MSTEGFPKKIMIYKNNDKSPVIEFQISRLAQQFLENWRILEINDDQEFALRHKIN